MYFLSEKFIFNNISSESMNVELVTFSDELFNEFGLSYSETVELEDGSSTVPSYNSTVNEAEDITLNLMLVNSEGTPKEWTSYELKEITSWLITDGFKPFISEDDIFLIYYLKCTSIKKQFTNRKLGYLEVTFKPYSPYAYKRVETVMSSRILIENVSNIGIYKPLIEIHPLEETIQIKNKSIQDSEVFEITECNEKIIIDNLLRTAQSESGKNMLSKCNRKWIKLQEGFNSLEVTGGKIKLICEFPVIC